jgi:hypothetical protein
MEYLDDIASDMSVFHRCDDIRALPARTLFSAIPRLPAYQGVMRNRAQEAAHGSQTVSAPSAAAGVPPQWAHLDPSVQRHLMAQQGPVADPDTVAARLAKAPGVQMWGEVRKVTPSA